ncbi:D-alanyl-D-alanine carboxypeptidase family protein, partial [Oribacterium parvum]
MLRLFKKVKKQKRFGFASISVFLVLILILSLFTPILSFADSWPSCPEAIEAEGAVLLDANSGTVLYAKNEHNKYFPASITKVLTAIVVLENVENLETKISFSSAATKDNLEVNSTVIGAVPGDKLSVRDCLYCLLLHSAN